MNRIGKGAVLQKAVFHDHVEIRRGDKNII